DIMILPIADSELDTGLVVSLLKKSVISMGIALGQTINVYMFIVSNKNILPDSGSISSVQFLRAATIWYDTRVRTTFGSLVRCRDCELIVSKGLKLMNIEN
ncbi:uncharacterized protein EV154DRAFT_414603, partial [Mucor mucedo]|uniref:uncharacterized protein n=1 Tax=Mucor mucedo TaxID=29922 RepID=UPI00221EC10B